MKQTILGEDSKLYSKKIKIRKTICIVTAVLIVALNALFTVLRTDDNHTAMLLLNIFTDLILGWFLIAFINFTILPMTNLFALSKRQTEKFKVSVSDVSDTTERIERYDCYRITVNERIFFLPENGKIKLKKGDTAIISVASNIITEAECL